MIKKRLHSIKSLFKEGITLLRGISKTVFATTKTVDAHTFQNGQLLASQLKLRGKLSNLQEAEFKVFSQWGDDGIIQYLIHYLDFPNTSFVEFGVEDYKESNTRFLLMNNNWSGLVMDGSESHIAAIKKSEFYWKYDLTAINAFITVENINTLISDAGFSGEIGLLHIDIDGNDYWIWKALEIVQPILMIVEYNSVFGSERSITVPYEAQFVRSQAHYSNLYAGASLGALCDLASEKGYCFVGSNSAGNNAYFIKNGYQKELKKLSLKEGYVQSKFRESRNENGELTYLRGDDRLQEIKGLPIYNTKSNLIEKI